MDSDVQLSRRRLRWSILPWVVLQQSQFRRLFFFRLSVYVVPYWASSTIRVQALQALEAGVSLLRDTSAPHLAEWTLEIGGLFAVRPTNNPCSMVQLKTLEAQEGWGG